MSAQFEDGAGVEAALGAETRKMLGRIVNLDLALLRTFVAVVDLRGVGRAAERVGRSQPAASLQLKRLEEMLGTPLFHRSGRDLRLNDSGDVLLSYARRLLELNDETVTAVSTLSMTGSIRFGIAQDFAESWLTSVLARFARAHPSTIIEIRADRNSALLDALARHDVDFALTFGEPGAPGAIDLGPVPMVWIGSKHRRWQAGNEIPLVMFEPPCEFRRVAVETLEQADMRWRLAFSSPSLPSQWSAIEAGLGVGVRTPIGLRPTLTLLDAADGLPPLPSTGLHVLLLSNDGKPGVATQCLQQVLIETVREKLRGAGYS